LYVRRWGWGIAKNVWIRVRHVQILVRTVSSGRRASYGSSAERARRDIAWREQPVERKKGSSKEHHMKHRLRLLQDKRKNERSR
jgi:hypothetical protein